jgi:ribosomal protein S18 acetylase RimI-like enzyme
VTGPAAVTLRIARPADASATAALHAAGIAEGFLPKLGPRVLRLLHKRMTLDRSSFVLVAPSDRGIDGFVAGTTDVKMLYKSFLRRDGIVAAVLAAPRAPKLWRGALETLRYSGRADAKLPRAELLAIAVDGGARGRGLGRALTRGLQDELTRRGVTEAKVVVGADNAAALALYRSTGFRSVGVVDVHRGRRSEVLVWP